MTGTSRRATNVVRADGRAVPRRVPYFTIDERRARGRAERSETRRRAHGEWTAAPARRDPVTLLEEQAATRVPELVPIRYGRMLTSPFAFYRGGAYLMAADLADGPRTGLHVQLCGDAHLSNFGGFAAPDRRLVFSINDFDETLPGPFEWDVKRLAASFAVAGRNRGFEEPERAGVVHACVRSYRTAMRKFATMRTLDLWYTRAEFDRYLSLVRARLTPKQMQAVEKNLAKAKTKDSLRAFDKMTHVVDGERRIVSDPPLIMPIEEVLPDIAVEQMHAFAQSVIRTYRRTLGGDRRFLLERFRYVHSARKVVGVGSVGTRAWIALMLGHDENDPLFLQVKEAQPSVLEPFVGASAFSNCGQRVVEGQRLTQAASDIMLGWVRAEGIDGVTRDFYVRQLWDGKYSPLVELMDPPWMGALAELCGWTLARAHARSGDSVAIASYLGNSTVFDRAMVSFAETYADQNERDYAALRTAVDTGRVTAVHGL